MRNTAENVLIRGVNWVGDAVMTLPAIRAIRRAMPDSRISLLVKPWVSPLFDNYPHVDEVMLHEDRRGGLRAVSGRLDLARALRERNFSRAVLLPNSFGSALPVFLARVPERIGYSRYMRGFMLTKAVPYGGEDRRMHHIDYYMELLNHAGIQAERSEPWLYLTLEERLRAREALKGLKRPVVGINPGAAYGSAKQWLPERFARVAERVIRELDGSAVIFGGPKETAIARDITARVRGHEVSGRLIALAGKTTLRELIALISECDVLVTNDSGPMHIGYAVKTPLVALFGSTDPELTGPVGAGNIVIKKDVPCGPCFLRKCKEPSLRCMEAIGAGEVFEAVVKLLPRARAVFFDRDGTLNEDAGYLNNWDDFKLLDGISAINALRSTDMKVIGVTNQSGVARGIVEEGFVRKVNALFVEKHGFHDFYYCPHHPDERCACRKPEPGMLLAARAEHGIDLRRSFMVGDKESDMLLARAVGARGIHVLTGEDKNSRSADFTVPGLREACDIVLSQV